MNLARSMRTALGLTLALLLGEDLVDGWLVQVLDSSAPKVAKNALALVVFGLSIVLVSLQRRWREFGTGADLALAGLGAVIALSALVNGIDVTLAAKALYVYLRGAIVFYAVRALRPGKLWQSRMLWVIGGWAVLNATVALAQVVIGPAAYTAIGWDDLTTAEIHRGQGFFAHANDLGHVLGLSLLVALAIAPRKWVLLGVLGAGLAATQSRESLMGVLLGLVVIGAHRRVGWRKLVVSAGVVALLAAIPFVVSGTVRTEVARRAAGVTTALGMPPPQQAPQNPELPVCGRPEPPPRRDRPGSPCRRPEPEEEIRVVYARQGLRLIQDRPVLGYGAGTFGGIVAVEADPQWNLHPRFGPDGFALHGFHGKTVDSFWLHLLVETGILGVLAYLQWLWMATARGVNAVGWALTGFATVIAVFSPALEGPTVAPLLFAALGVIFVNSSAGLRAGSLGTREE